MRDTSLGGPYSKDYSILGSILGYPSFGKLPTIWDGRKSPVRFTSARTC